MVPDGQRIAHHWAAFAVTSIGVPDHHVITEFWGAKASALGVIEVLSSFTSDVGVALPIASFLTPVESNINTSWCGISLVFNAFAIASISIKIIIFIACWVCIGVAHTCAFLLVEVFVALANEALSVAVTSACNWVPVEACLADVG